VVVLEKFVAEQTTDKINKKLGTHSIVEGVRNHCSAVGVMFNNNLRFAQSVKSLVRCGDDDGDDDDDDDDDAEDDCRLLLS